MAFFRGNGRNLLTFVPNQALVLGSFSQLYYQNNLNPFLAGAAAGVGSVVVSHPINSALVAARKSAYRREPGPKYTGTYDAFRKIPLRELYESFGITTVGVAVYRSILFGIYFTFRSDHSWSFNFALAYASCGAALLTSYPIDTVRRRATMSYSKDEAAESRQRFSFRKLYKLTADIVEKEGVRSLTKGAGSSVMRAISGAVGLVLFDGIFTKLVKPPR